MMIWKKKSKLLIKTQEFVKEFNIFLKQTNKQTKKKKVKHQGYQRQKRKKNPCIKCALCDSKNSRFINKQEASGLLSA